MLVELTQLNKSQICWDIKLLSLTVPFTASNLLKYIESTYTWPILIIPYAEYVNNDFHIAYIMNYQITGHIMWLYWNMIYSKISLAHPKSLWTVTITSWRQSKREWLRPHAEIKAQICLKGRCQKSFNCLGFLFLCLMGYRHWTKPLPETRGAFVQKPYPQKVK